MISTGIGEMSASFELQIRDGKIVFWLSRPDPEDWSKLVSYATGGVGIRGEVTGQGMKVTEVAVNSPAAVAGINSGDTIIAVNGISYRQMREGEIQLRIKGPVGSKVVLIVIHEGSSAPTDVEVTCVDLAQLRWQ